MTADASQYYIPAPEINREQKRTLTNAEIIRCRQIALGNKAAIRAIVAEVAAEAGISPAEIIGKSRVRAVVEARQIVMAAAHRAGMSYARIGSALGRDHTTIAHGIKAEKARRGE